jgi:hypothetical protein
MNGKSNANKSSAMMKVDRPFFARSFHGCLCNRAPLTKQKHFGQMSALGCISAAQSGQYTTASSALGAFTP